MKAIKSIRLQSLWAIGFAQAAGLVAYVVLFVSVFFNLMNGTNLSVPILAPMIMLTAFVFSALVCSCIAFMYPVLLVIKGDTKRAVQVVLWTAGWLLIFVLIGVTAATMLRTSTPVPSID